MQEELFFSSFSSLSIVGLMILTCTSYPSKLFTNQLLTCLMLALLAGGTAWSAILAMVWLVKVILLMIKVLDYLRNPKLWELWYIPYNG